MPIKVEDAKKYEGYEQDEVKIHKFLTTNIDKAYAEEEIAKGIGKEDLAYTPDEKGSNWTWQNVANFTVNVLNGISFRDTLDQMVNQNKISVREVAGKKYYFAEEKKPFVFTAHGR